jgi:Tfp pilus assembly protein PilN
MLEFEAEIDRYLAEMKRLNELMRKDQAEIDRLKAETRAMQADTRAIIDRLLTMVQPMLRRR